MMILFPFLYKQVRFMLLLTILGLGAVLFSGCSSSKFSFGSNHSNVTPTPTLVTLLPEVAVGYQVVSDKSCQLATYIPITTDLAQGDLMAWKPDAQQLAYVGPQNGSWSWYVGALYITDVAANKNLYTSSNLRVFGDLAWSPGGNSLALVNLQSGQKDSYTVMVLQPASNQVTDLFPGKASQMDAFDSKKGVDAWLNDQSLTVTASCGPDCAQVLQFNADGSGKQVVKEERIVDNTSLALSDNVPQYDTAVFPKMNQPNWSPDRNWIVYVDDDDATWILNIPNKTEYRLGWLGNFIRETKWSADSKLLAIRMDNQILVYQVACQ
jgi:Tol biopolymer transport system component